MDEKAFRSGLSERFISFYLKMSKAIVFADNTSASQPASARIGYNQKAK